MAATDALVIKHQAISIHSADEIFFVLDKFNTEILQLWSTLSESKIIYILPPQPMSECHF